MARAALAGQTVSAAIFAALLASGARAALVYGGATETGSLFNPGAGTITYMNCFTALASASQDRLVVDEVVVGIRRRANFGALVDVGLRIHVAEMTFDGGQLGLGTSHLVYSTASLGGGSATLTQSVATGAVSVAPLLLETVSRPGFGGWWIGVEFTGPNAASQFNGWRVVNAPTTGVSNNAYATLHVASGAFVPSNGFGNPPGSSPSRMMVNVDGAVVAAPWSLALVGLAGAVARRRR